MILIWTVAVKFITDSLLFFGVFFRDYLYHMTPVLHQERLNLCIA